ncbi:hypothetical protein EYC84_011038 [Monilinia fructicola]|uniref:Uncharacterized protein n=1 Tax=Monilinia fructicola TaxID=38448 RepID=A0A5M9J935_MONFR|nr:hypothetical protein EYC84_011038 [Monilinia fructicola]
MLQQTQSRHKRPNEVEKERLASAPPPPKASSPRSHENPAPRPGTLAAAHAKGPFECLDDSDELREVFKKIPQLAIATREDLQCDSPPDGLQFAQLEPR